MIEEMLQALKPRVTFICCCCCCLQHLFRYWYILSIILEKLPEEPISMPFVICCCHHDHLSRDWKAFFITLEEDT